MAKSCILREYKDYDVIVEYPSWKALEANENIRNQWAKWTTYKGRTIEEVNKYLNRINKNFKVRIISLKKSGKKRIAKIKLVKK